MYTHYVFDRSRKIHTFAAELSTGMTELQKIFSFPLSSLVARNEGHLLKQFVVLQNLIFDWSILTDVAH
jgi:hypothetical protein